MAHDISRIDVAKECGQYLKITLPDNLISAVQKEFRHYDKYHHALEIELAKADEKEEQEFEAKLKAQGIDTDEKRAVYDMTDCIRAVVSRAVRRYGNSGTLELSYGRFETWLLEEAIAMGVNQLEQSYNPIGVRLQTNIINLDFKEKAKKWLLQEIYSRLSTNDSFTLLDEVSVQKHSEGIVRLTQI